MTDEEDVRLKVSHVRSKKVEGTLFMMGDRMGWMPNNKDVFTICFDYADIKVQRTSSELKSKMRLQIILYDDTMTTFHFSNPASADQQRKDREMVKDLLQTLLPEFQLKMNQQLGIKSKILDDNKAILQLYKDLVMSGIMSADDFWKKYVDIEKLTENNKPQSTGVSGALFSTIRPESNEKGGVKYTLTTDMILSIFRAYPSVKEKYDQNVTVGRLTEAEFWRTFFQSQYFAMDRVPTSNSRDLFTDCTRIDDEKLSIEAEKASKRTMGVIAPETNETSEMGYGVNETERASSSTSAAKQLIKRFNFHSTMILKSNLGDENIVTTTENNDNSTSTAQKKDVETINDDDDDENSAKRFKPDDDFEELRSEQKEEVETLKLINPERYLRAPPPTNNGRAQKNILNPTPIASVNNLKLQMADWTANTELNLNSQLALKVMTELSPGGALMHGTSSQTLSQIVPQAIQEEMQNIYTSLRELLRHFWSCFPPSTPQIEEKIRRVHETLERFRTTKVVPFKEKVLTDTLADFHLVGHIESLLDKASKKYAQWSKTMSTSRT